MLGWKEKRGSRCYIRNISARESNLLTLVLEGPPHQLLKVLRPSLTIFLTVLPALHFSSFWDKACCIEAGIAWQPQGFQQGSACYSSCSQTFILQVKRGKLQMTLFCRQKFTVSYMSCLQSCRRVIQKHIKDVHTGCCICPTTSITALKDVLFKMIY